MSHHYTSIADALAGAGAAFRRGFRHASRQLESSLLPGETILSVDTAGVDGIAAITDLPGRDFGRVILARRDSVRTIDPTATGIKVKDKTHVVKFKVPGQPRLVIQRTPTLGLYPDPEWIGREAARHVAHVQNVQARRGVTS